MDATKISTGAERPTISIISRNISEEIYRISGLAESIDRWAGLTEELPASKTPIENFTDELASYLGELTRIRMILTHAADNIGLVREETRC